MKPEEKEFLEKNFKAGEYAMLQIMVRFEDIQKLIQVLKTSNLNLAVLPTAKAKTDFFTDDGDNKPKN